MVLLGAAAGEGSSRRPAEPDDGGRILEGHRLSGLRLLLRQQGDRTEEDDGVLQGKSAHRNQNQVEDERVQSNR